MYKLKNKQLIHLTKGKYHDGGGLYIRITRQGKGLWTYRYNLNKTSHEMSLGTFPEVKLSEAREKLAEQKRLKLKQINPLHEKRKHEILKVQQNKKFSEIAEILKFDTQTEYFKRLLCIYCSQIMLFLCILWHTYI